MVGHTADLEQDAPFFAKDAAHVSIEAFAKRLTDERSAMFGAEDDVEEEIGEGVCHGGGDCATGEGACRPYGAWGEGNGRSHLGSPLFRRSDPRLHSLSPYGAPRPHPNWSAATNIGQTPGPGGAKRM